MVGLFGSNTSLIFVSNDLKMNNRKRTKISGLALSFWLLGSLLTARPINPKWVGLAVLVSSLTTELDNFLHSLLSNVLLIHIRIISDKYQECVVTHAVNNNLW